MIVRYHMPEPADVVTILETLFGRRPEVSAGAKAGIGMGSYLGVYRDNEGEVHGICIFDGGLALSLGGALSMVPAAVLAEVRNTQQLPEIFVQNLHEVFNICVRFFTRYSDVSMRLHDVIKMSGGIPRDVAACVAASKRCDFSVLLPGYGGGVMSLFLMKAQPHPAT